MRDINKAIADYKKQFFVRSNKGQFYVSDFVQIKELSDGTTFDIIANGMMAGFMIGYRFAKREMKNRSKYTATVGSMKNNI